MNADYKKYKLKMQKLADVNYSSAVLQWDQEIYMPPKSAEKRAQQLATLAGISHELAVNNELGDLIKKLHKNNNLSVSEKRNIKLSRKDYRNRKKYSTDFVEKLSRATSEGFNHWQLARKENNFEIFAPSLKKIVSLKQKESELLGYKNHPYDALLDQFEPGAKTKEIDELFTGVKPQLIALIKAISKKPKPADKFLHLHYDKQKQWDFGIELLKQMHYDFDAGRQDVSAHPFTTSFSAKDVRVTTRINEKNLSEMVWSCIHEGGHALYEQGLNDDDYGIPTGEAISLGIHESQSRLWENNVGRGKAYWKKNYPLLQKYFPENLSATGLDDFYKAINRVQPSLIRTSADELTYHSHIMIRFELEKQLLEGSLEVKDLPAVWNSKYKEYLNIDVPNDSQGVLQDVHWSHGGMGYFPTYSLGSFYAAQFFASAKKDAPGLEAKIEKGDMLPLLEWLRDKIHRHGKLYSASELCQKITGEKLNFSYFMDYATIKYKEIYEL